MAKFRKKPVVIEARQFDGTIDSAQAIRRWAHHGLDSATNSVVTIDGIGDPEFVIVRVRTLEGQMTATAGDWIIRGVKGFYPCKPDIFAATYEAVDEQ